MPTKILVWDNIGNTLLGVRPWAGWAPRIKERLLAEDPDAETDAPSFDQLFADREVELTWLYDPARLGAGFDDLLDDFAGRTRPLADPAELVDLLADVDYLVVHKERLPIEAVAGAERLRLVQHLGQDARGVPVELLRLRQVPVAATPLVNYLAVAEHVWAFILNHAKRLPGQRRRMEARDYLDSWGLHPGVVNVRDLTLGLLGFGEIARPVARVARAFEMPTLYWDVERFPELEGRYGVRYAEWDEIFRRSDVLSVQLALNDRTAGIVGARELGLMKPTALFVNTARGKLVDQAALGAALRERRLGGGALDVFAEEPLPADDPLHDLHADPEANVTLTPHSAWQSPWTWIRDSREIWDNVLRSLSDEPIRHLI
jgi:phosphoglycerate dehydrogenase-like enzyme